MPVIRATHLGKTFDGGQTYALKDVNVEIEAGEFVAIIGLSGAGKSTFLRSIIGTHRPSEGELEVLGTPISTLNSKELKTVRKQVGFIFQQFNLIKNISVLQNVLVGRVAFAPWWRRWTGFFSDRDKQRAIHALDSVGLKGRYSDKARNLSGGQQQRVAIARALVQNPRIILADEPMASLDPKLSEVVLDILAQINRSQQITVLVNIHVLELASKYAKRILAFRKGHLVYDGPSSELTREKLETIYQLDAQTNTVDFAHEYAKRQLNP